jgi:hypothetical protein
LVPTKLAEGSAGSQEDQRSKTLAHATPEEPQPVIENSDEDLKYLKRMVECLQKHRRIKELRRAVQAKTTHA